MRDINEIRKNKKLMWKKSFVYGGGFIHSGYINLSTGVRASFVLGANEGGMEHLSIELYAKRLPTWREMCEAKSIFWEDEEEVVQIHPKKSEYVNITEALHLWRPIDGDWSRMNNMEKESINGS